VIGESRGLGSGEVRAGAAAMVSVRAYVIDRERERVTATDAAVAYDATASAHGFRAEGRGETGRRDITIRGQWRTI
jgi:hypothetical protein